MAMPLWRYVGRITKAVEIPGKGPTVIKPQEEFRAPRAAVAELIKIKKVVGPLREQGPKPKPTPVKKAESKPERKPTPLPKADAKASPKLTKKTVDIDTESSQGDAKADVTVVASESSSATTELVDEDAGEESRSKEEEKGEEKKKKSRRKKSRSRS